ncbi:uncharacterized protein K452DRAFT_232286 [Aplosporella prunicola CBS 121167]|uniref:Wax synthase domain-containing protein n=1 Tax=Aplosporella prunicola CBS 121167 TaxID=1176127 RepID=A0A6A6B7Y9_9PEZI|nr:uncharacterized protein K452DRAFT_232286 [Aplosporella prunicola CBS 121167]KAF2139375.1 hypothetical protein K452DRAFT_232286 [Aplosporella prunicola CBS 121167]
MWLQLLNASDLLFFHPVSFEDEGRARLSKAEHPASISASLTRARQQVEWALSRLFNLRHIGTRTQVKNVPAFSRANEDYVPSRTRFLLRRIFTVAVAYLVVDLISSQPPPPDLDAAFSPHKQYVFSRFTEITGEEVLGRFLGTLAFWLSLASLIQLLYNVPAIVAVATGISEPESWPPLTEWMSEGWNLRRFWGLAWHQCLRQPLTTHATYLVSLLSPTGLSESWPLLPRYARLLATFALSGLLHCAAEHAALIPSAEAGALRYFIMQGVGIMVEDAVAGLWQRQQRQEDCVEKGESEGEGGKEVRMWVKAAGWAWVVLWQVWTTPGWSWPFARHARPGVDRMVPGSVIRLLAAGA